MIAKLIVWDETRDGALARMRKALADYQVAGLTTNIDFLSRLVACPAFAGADLDTGLIERQKDFLFPEIQPVPRDALLVATVGELLWEQHAAKATAQRSGDPHSPWHARDGWRMNLSAARTISFKDGDTLVDVQVSYRRDSWKISLNGESTVARGKKLDGDRFAVELDDRRLIASVVAVDDKRSVFLHGSTYSLLRDDPLHRVDAGDSHGGGLTAPMPGKVVALLAQPGQKVEKGTPLLILEAMKMEHTITAPAAGTVKAFCYAAGEQVADGAALVEFEGES
jgi:3-methylcrotonyl-CoA carboxylase alpha subunit